MTLISLKFLLSATSDRSRVDQNYTIIIKAHIFRGGVQISENLHFSSKTEAGSWSTERRQSRLFKEALRV